MTNRMSEVKLKYTVDQASLNAATKSAATLDKSLKNLQSTTTELNKTTQKASETTRQFAQSSQTAQRTSEQRQRALNQGQRLLGATGQVLGGGGVGDVVRFGQDVAGFTEQVSALGKAAPVAGLALAGAVIALQAYNAEVERQRKIVEDQVKLNLELADLRRKATTVEVEERKKATEQRIADATGERDRLAAETAKIQAGRSAVFQGILSSVFDTLNVKVKANQTEIDKLNDGLTKDQAELAGLTGELTKNAFAANDAAAAQKAFTDNVLKVTKDRRDLELEAANAIRTGTSTAAKERLAALQAEFDSNKEYIKQLQAIKDPTDAVKNELKQTVDRQLQLQAALAKYRDTIVPSIERTEAFKKGIQSVADAIKNMVERAKEVATRLIEEERKKNEATVSAVKSYNDDVARIEEDNLKARADVEAKYADRLVDIARQAADDAAASLKRLQDKQAELRVGYERDEIDAARQFAIDQNQAQIEAQRQEAQALRDHQRNLEKIRKDAQDKEFELILNRDFAGLFMSRRQTSRQMEEANQGFVAGQSDRAATLKAQQDDARRQYEQERADRLRNYQQSLADARAAYVAEQVEIRQQKIKQLADARTVYQRELADQAAKYTAELALRRKAIQAELQLIQMGVQQRLTLEAQAQAALLAQARSIMQSASAQQAAQVASYRGPTAARSHFMAAGGAARAGGSYIVNEPGSSGMESYSANGKTMYFPGMGTWMPAANGQVNANKGANINMPITISGAGNPEATARLVGNEVTKRLEAVFGRVS